VFMAGYDWGIDEAPAIVVPASPRLPLAPEELPEVLKLQQQGWALAPAELMWGFLPAVWPRSHRTWIADRATRWASRYREAQFVGRVPWSDALRAEIESDYNELLREVGIDPRPRDRLWLLKPPASFTTLADAIDAVVRPTMQPGSEVEPSCNPGFVDHVRRTVGELFSAGRC
jgi:hypothetical protein